MSEKPNLAAESDDEDRVYPSSGQDWATWLRHAHHGQPPRSRPPSPGHAETAWTTLTHLARREGFTVERANCAAADGFTSWRNRKIRIRPDAAPSRAVTALAHQLGHVLLHGQIARQEPSGTVPCTGIRKVEADSVAYLTAAHTGIDATQIAFPHVASWAGTDPRARPAATIQAVTARILTATATITTPLDAAGVTGAQPATGVTSAQPTASVTSAPPGGLARAEGVSGARPTTRARAARLPIAGQRAGALAPQDEVARVHDRAALFFRSQMPGSWAPGYLASRGLGPTVQDHWLAGHAPAAWDALTRHLRAAGYPDALIEAAGLARRSRHGTLIDTFRDRALLPIRAADGTIVAFIGRAADHAGNDIPKYLNSPSTSLYDKGAVLFGLWEARDTLATGARPVIVEGPLDAIAVTTASHGRYAGVAPCGTALTARHAAALSRAAELRTTGVTVAFDPDEAGQRAAVRACHLLVPLTDKLAAVTLPKGHDPAQILADSGPATLAGILSSGTRPLPDLVINAEIRRWTRRRLREVEGQIGALRAAAPLIAAMPPAHVGRQVARLAAILRLDYATVTEAVTDALTELVTNPPDSSRRHTTAHQADLPGRPTAGIRAAGRDSPHSAQQAIDQVAAAVPSPAPNNPASTGRLRLTSRRVPG
jgi:DNA primase